MLTDAEGLEYTVSFESRGKNGFYCKVAQLKPLLKGLGAEIGDSLDIIVSPEDVGGPCASAGVNCLPARVILEKPPGAMAPQHLEEKRRQQQAEEQCRQLQAEACRRQKEEAQSKREQDERRQREEAQRRQQEEAERQRRQQKEEAERQRQQQEQEAERRQQQEEEQELQRRQQEEAETKGRQQEEEAERQRRKQEEEEQRRQREEEARLAAKRPAAEHVTFPNRGNPQQGGAVSDPAGAASMAGDGVDGPGAGASSFRVKMEHSAGHSGDYTAGAGHTGAGHTASPLPKSIQDAAESGGTNRLAVFQALGFMLRKTGLSHTDRQRFLTECIMKEEDDIKVAMHWSELSSNHQAGELTAMREWVALQLLTQKHD